MVLFYIDGAIQKKIEFIGEAETHDTQERRGKRARARQSETPKTSKGIPIPHPHQPSERHLRQRLIERLALDVRHLKLKRRRLPAPVRVRERARAPGASTVHLRDVRELGERVLVPERDEDDAVVDEGGDRV
jgi:hypothetical protein